jgi:hypothetical protein
MGGALRVSVALVAILALAVPAAAARSRPRAPTAPQIRRAVESLKRSRDLWATVDICNTRRHPRDLGIRGQMPSLGFGTTHEMNIQVEYRPSAKIGFKPDPHVNQSVALGYSANKLLQGGWIFARFPRHTGLLRATVAFVWRRGHKQIARIARTTTGGHRDVDHADPPKFSAAQCLIW